MLLDTNALSAWARDDADLMRVLRSDRPWYLPSIVLGEYRYGLLKSNLRHELESWLEEIEESCGILAPDGETARYYAELRFSAESESFEPPYHDLWIGALALQHNVAVVSRDGHFEKTPGVRRLGW